MTASVIVVGGGITGLATAAALVDSGIASVTVIEGDRSLGGRIRTSTFAGLEIDEGPDAFLIRVPAALDLARAVGLGDDLVSPTAASAAIWQPRHGGDPLHRLPGSVVLGVPADLGALATSSLFSWRGRLRAAVEPFLPATDTTPDSLGRYVRARLGDEIHERLVDSLVGSIYATDTDRMSLRSVPQIAALAEGHRSLILAARRSVRAARSRPAPAAIFAAPRRGVGALVDALAAHLGAAGVEIVTGTPIEAVERHGDGWQIDGRLADQVVLATPADASATMLGASAPDAAALLARNEVAGVIMVTLAVTAWPERLTGLSGYLVPKPLQRHVTAASFGSQKWDHWRTGDDRQILRVSLGRDGLDVGDLDDRTILETTVAEVGDHLGLDLEVVANRITRWPAAFPQYRPGHPDWVEAIERALPPGVHLAGASYRGIGIPACVADAERAARRVALAAGR